uniref:Uncharacterized protein n=1 Tax=Ananas comosus var. bracteatus TaxID=296719 RepID=A0A6V7PHS3_ANACO|nr:unnamed protein product [Ananas comosus var. bracteatus]
MRGMIRCEFGGVRVFSVQTRSENGLRNNAAAKLKKVASSTELDFMRNRPRVVLVSFGKAKDVKITKSALETSPREQIVQNLHWSKTALGDRSLAGKGPVPSAGVAGLLDATGPWQGEIGPRT